MVRSALETSQKIPLASEVNREGDVPTDTTENTNPLVQKLGRFQVYFALSKWDLNASDLSYLRDVAKHLIDSHESILLVGHCDRTGSDEFNKALSQKRAMRVAKTLADLRVPKNKIFVDWVSNREPVQFTDEQRAEIEQAAQDYKTKKGQLPLGIKINHDMESAVVKQENLTERFILGFNRRTELLVRNTPHLNTVGSSYADAHVSAPPSRKSKVMHETTEEETAEDSKSY